MSDVDIMVCTEITGLDFFWTNIRAWASAT